MQAKICQLSKDISEKQKIINDLKVLLNIKKNHPDGNDCTEDNVIGDQEQQVDNELNVEC
jgi:hypothetical protein